MAGRLMINKVSHDLLLGVCVPCIRNNVSKISVTTLDFDDYLNMHFKKVSDFYAHDPQKICKTGDIILMKKLQTKCFMKDVTHEVVRVMFPLGAGVDPITGKRMAGTQYMDEVEELSSLYGSVSSSFNYDEAPERGSQEGKKDFSDKPMYKRYHVFQEDEEEYNDPYSYS